MGRVVLVSARVGLVGRVVLVAKCGGLQQVWGRTAQHVADCGGLQQAWACCAACLCTLHKPDIAKNTQHLGHFHL